MKNKKAFTVVELVIVIAIIAILAAVLIPTFASLIKKANVSKDMQLIRNLNTALASNKAENGGKDHRNMTEALEAAEKFGYEVDKINASATDNEILWDQANDVFCYLNGDKVEYTPDSVEQGKKLTKGNYQLWKIYNDKSGAVPAYSDQTYSIYLGDAADLTDALINNVLQVKVGIDVGKVNDIKTIKYSYTPNPSLQETAHEATIIRTNSANTELIVEAPQDTVKHFDSVGTVYIISVDSNNCYEENGKAAFTQIDSGKYKTTATADVELLFVSASSVKVEVAPGTVHHAHAISEQVAGTLNGNHPGVTFDYDGNADQSSLNDVYHHIQPEDQVQFTGDFDSNKAKGPVVEAVNKALEDTVFKGVSISKTGVATQLMTIEEFRDSVNDGNSYGGYTVKLLDNINLENVEWTPLKLFAGTFDGNNKTLSGLKLNESTDISSGYVDIGFFEKTENATIKNLTIDGFEIYGTGRISSGTLVGNASNGLTLKNVIVTSTNKLTGKWSGGLMGRTSVTMDGSNKRDCKYIIDNCHSSVEIIGERTGGFVGQMDGCNYSIYNSSNGFATFTSCSFDGNVNANKGTAMAAGFVAQFTGGDRTWFVYTYQNCSVNDATIDSSGSKGDFTAVSQSAFSILNCRINDENVILPTQVNFAFCNSKTVYAYSINGTIYAIKAANSGYYNVESDTIGVDAQVAGSSDYNISLSDTTDWHKVTNAYTDFYGNYIVSADASVIYRSVPTNLEEGTKLQRRTYVAGHDYSAHQDTYGLDMWRIVNSDIAAEGIGFGQWQDVGNDGATGFVLGAGIYYYLDPTPFVDLNLYNVSSRETSNDWMIYTVTAK